MITQNILTNFSDKEIAVIKAVDALGSATVSEIARKANIKRTTVYNFIDDLVDSGLIALQEINGIKRYFNPNESLALMEQSNLGLTGKYGSFSMLVTREAIRKAVNGTLKARDKRVEWMIGSLESTNCLGKRFIEKYIDKAFEKGVEIRTLRSTPETDKQQNLKAKSLPFKTTVIIQDNTLIFISPDFGGVGYVVKDRAMAESFRFIFMGLWDHNESASKESND